MTDEQLATAIPRMDQTAYLAGLQTVSRAENLEMRKNAGLGSTTRARAAMDAERRQRIAKARAAIMPHVPETGTTTISEIAKSMGCSPATLFSRMTMLAGEGHLERLNPPEGGKGPMRWARR